MIFLIIEDNRTYSYFSFEDSFSYKGINIYSKNNTYYIELHNGYTFLDNTKTVKLEYRKYTIISENNCYETDVYVFDSEKGFDNYRLVKRKDFLISAHRSSNIISSNPFLKNSYLSVFEDTVKTNDRVYINSELARKEQKIKTGDRIFYRGLIIDAFQEFYYMNDFMCTNHLDKYIVRPKKVSYFNKKEYPSIHISENVKRCEIDSPKEYHEPKLDKKELNTIIPNVVMVISISLIAGISFYNSYLNNQPILSRLTFIVMPIAMMITSVLFPLFSFYINKRNNNMKMQKSIDDYLDYLDVYENKTIDRIKVYIDECDSYYFSLLNCENKMFSLKRTDQYFLHISLGKTKTCFTFEYKETGKEIIDRKLASIKQKLANVDGYPLMLNVNNYSRISIISNREEKFFIFNKVLLELCYKHHYDDLLICIYSKDANLINDFFNLPHLFYLNERMSLANEKQLRYLDQIKTDRKIILLMYDNSSYTFLNKDIHVIYFSDRRVDVLKNNDVLIEYHNRISYFYEKEKTEFVYNREDIDFKIYYTYLGKLKSFKKTENTKTLCDIFNENEIDKYYLNHDNKLKAIFAYNKDELLHLDLHESGQGPHGLIGGSTGSGKSELIISFLLSLCVKYPPDYLNIVLIDYKGSGLMDSLSYMGKTLKHISASVNNLENNGLQRLIIALNLECKKRQYIFNKVGKLSLSPVVNLDDYLNNDYRKNHYPKLAHLLIVVDEFAELKKNNPKEIKDLISISRIGRSLGIHLVLATQKPSGVIDEEIWSNSRFKIALKVYDERDSHDLIKTGEAAYLDGPGNFLIRVDDDTSEYQSVYSKTDVGGNEPYKVALLDNMLNTIAETKKMNLANETQCELFIKNIIDTCDRLKYNVHSIDFMEPYPLARKKLCSQKCFVIGEIDDYLNNRKGLLAYDLRENLLINYSNRKSIHSYLNTLNEYKRKTVVIAGRYYHNEMISDCLLYHENEDIEFLFAKLNEDNLDICLFIEDVYALLSYKENYLDLLTSFMKKIGDKKTNILCFTSNSGISYRLINAFDNRIILNTKDRSSLIDFYAMKSQYLGTSFFYRNEPVSFIPVLAEDFVYGDSELLPLIPHIPEVIENQLIQDYIFIGYDIEKRQKIFADKSIHILSYENHLVEPYRKYEGVNIDIYKNDFRKINGDILFVGPGIFNQHAFVALLRNDLKQDEGLYIHNGEQRKVKVLNNA